MIVVIPFGLLELSKSSEILLNFLCLAIAYEKSLKLDCSNLQAILNRDDRIRTCDPRIPNAMRYQAALHPVVMLYSMAIRTQNSTFADFLSYSS